MEPLAREVIQGALKLLKEVAVVEEVGVSPEWLEVEGPSEGAYLCFLVGLVGSPSYRFVLLEVGARGGEVSVREFEEKSEALSLRWIMCQPSTR